MSRNQILRAMSRTWILRLMVNYLLVAKEGRHDVEEVGPVQRSTIRQLAREVVLHLRPILVQGP